MGADVERGSWGRANGSWPPFEVENEVALAHGAHSPRKRQPIEAALVQWAHEVAPWTNDPVAGPAVEAWARHESMVLLLAAHLDVHGIEDDEGEIRGAVGQLRRYEAAAARHRAAVGLDPHSKLALVRGELAAEREQTDLAAVRAAGRQTAAGGGDPIDTTADPATTEDR